MLLFIVVYNSQLNTHVVYLNQSTKRYLRHYFHIITFIFIEKFNNLYILSIKRRKDRLHEWAVGVKGEPRSHLGIVSRIQHYLFFLLNLDVHLDL